MLQKHVFLTGLRSFKHWKFSSEISPFCLENNLHTFHWLYNVLVSPYDYMDQASHQGGDTNEYKKDVLKNSRQ